MKTQTLAWLALATMAFMGLGPAAAAPICAAKCRVTATAEFETDVNSVHVEASARLFVTDGTGTPIVNETHGTGPVDATLVCSGNCTIVASTPAYVPPVFVLRSGSNITWHSIDIGHIQRDTAQPLGSPSACFAVSSPGGGDSPPVRFDITGLTLTATVGATSTTCLNAIAADGEAFVLPYHCTLHPNMRGALVVVP